MEHINNIEIKNFKSIRHQKIEGCKRINVFIGYPNVGKSNILECLGLFSFIQGGSNLRLDSLLRLKKFPELFFDGNIKQRIDVTINEQQSVEIEAESFHQINITCREKSEGKWHKIYSGKLMDDDSYAVGDNSSHIKEIFWFRVKKYSFKSVFESGELTNSSSLSYPNGENIYDIISIDKALAGDVGELFQNYDLSLAVDQSTGQLKILKRLPNGNIFLISYHQIADTLQRLIFYKTAIKSNQNSVLLLEEPESHMFPPYIKKFTSDIIFDETNQFFIATHSPYVITELIEEVQNDLAIYVVDYNKGETVIKRLTDEEVSEVAQYGIDLFFNLESYLDRYEQPHSA